MQRSSSPRPRSTRGPRGELKVGAGVAGDVLKRAPSYRGSLSSKRSGSSVSASSSVERMTPTGPSVWVMTRGSLRTTSWSSPNRFLASRADMTFLALAVAIVEASRWWRRWPSRRARMRCAGSWGTPSRWRHGARGRRARAPSPGSDGLLTRAVVSERSAENVRALDIARARRVRTGCATASNRIRHTGIGAGRGRFGAEGVRVT